LKEKKKGEKKKKKKKGKRRGKNFYLCFFLELKRVTTRACDWMSGCGGKD
jgi:hypothetical protein